MLTPSAKSLSALPVPVVIVPMKSMLAAAALPSVAPKDLDVEFIAISCFAGYPYPSHKEIACRAACCAIRATYEELRTKNYARRKIAFGIWESENPGRGGFCGGLGKSVWSLLFNTDRDSEKKFQNRRGTAWY